MVYVFVRLYGVEKQYIYKVYKPKPVFNDESSHIFRHCTQYILFNLNLINKTCYIQWGGVFLATLIVILGAGLGASTAFLLGRFVFREKVESYKSKYEKFDIIDKVVEQQGLKVTILLRLSPVIPFSAFNYFMGLTSVSFKDYNIAHLGMIPGTLAYCFIGGTLGAIGDSVNALDPVVLGVTIGGTILAIVGMVYISYVAKKEFAKIAEQQKQQEMDADPENGAAPTDGGATIEGNDVEDDAPPKYDEADPSAPGNDNENGNDQSLSLGNQTHSINLYILLYIQDCVIINHTFYIFSSKTKR